MIKKLIILLILCFPISGFSQNGVSLGMAYDWEQLDQTDQDLIKKSSQKYLVKLADNDIEGFWNLCHSKFKESTPLVSFKQVGDIMANMIHHIDSVKFIDAKKVVYSAEPSTSKFSTGGSLDKENPTYLQFYTIAGIKNQALSIYKIKNKPLSKAITIKLGLENEEYKLTSIEINTSSINEKDANYYSRLADEWAKKESKFPQFIAANMAYRLSYLGRGTSTSLSLKVMDTLQKLQKNTELISEIKKWNINDSIFDIINVDFLETQNDVTPNILYISKVPLGKESTKKEVEILYEYFKNKYPSLVKEFGMIMFTAYEEYPALKTKTYTFFRVIMYEEKELAGKWKVVDIIKKPTIPQFAPLTDGFENATFFFNKNGNFKLSTTSNTKLFGTITQMTNGTKWKLAKNKQYVQIGNKEDDYSIMGISILENNGNKIFHLDETGITLEMKKIE